MFQPRDIEGEPVTEQIEYVRELFEGYRKQDPRLKALTIIGGTLKGYTKPDSDIDVALIYDDPPENAETFSSTYIGFVDYKNKIMEDRQKEGLPVFKVTAEQFTNVHDFHHGKIGEHINNGFILGSLIFPAIGDIEPYRSLVGKELNGYPPEKRMELINEMAADLIAVQSEDKLIQRGVVSSADYNDFAEKKKGAY